MAQQGKGVLCAIIIASNKKVT